MTDAPYLAELGAKARVRAPERLEEILGTIRGRGLWEEAFEWRISTVMTSRVEPEEASGRRWFKVTVRCGAEFACRAPTLERAVEFLGVFEQLTMDLFYALGWSTWAAEGRLAPAVGETVPPTPS